MRITSDRRFFLSGRLGALAVLIPLILLTAACITHPPKYETPPELTADRFESADNSLPIMVTELNWNLLHGGSHIQASGTVRNIGQDVYQSVTLHGLFLNEQGKTLGRGSSFITPSYLPPGKEGAFEMTIMLTTNKPVKHLHLISNAQTAY